MSAHAYPAVSHICRKDRLKHSCWLCGLPIERGEQYTKQTQVEAGRHDSFFWHDKCKVEYDDLADDDDDEISEHALWEWATESYSAEYQRWYYAKRLADLRRVPDRCSGWVGVETKYDFKISSPIADIYLDRSSYQYYLVSPHLQNPVWDNTPDYLCTWAEKVLRQMLELAYT